MIGDIAIATDVSTIIKPPSATLIDFIRLTSPGILNDPMIPLSLIVLNPTIANKETCYPMVLRIPIMEHWELVIQLICILQYSSL